jgi:predicted transcriptional regulator of viral defense system
VRTARSYATLEQLRRPVVTTREASVAWGLDPSATTHALSRLAEVSLVKRLRQGVWQIGSGTLDPLLVLPVLTQPYPSHVSMWSALFGHGMIEQIPRSVYAVSLGRARSVRTEAGEFRIHHVTPDLYGGAEGGTSLRAGTATPEKALFDTVYLLSARSGTVSLPELELPDGFDATKEWWWVDRIPADRLRTMVSRKLDRILASATGRPTA